MLYFQANMYSTSRRNGNPANGNRSGDLPQFLSEKWKLSYLGPGGLDSVFTYPVLYRVSAESRAGEWDLWVIDNEKSWKLHYLSASPRSPSEPILSEICRRRVALIKLNQGGQSLTVFCVFFLCVFVAFVVFWLIFFCASPRDSPTLKYMLEILLLVEMWSIVR